MEFLVLSLALLALLALNAFFVLAEFAVVKVRPSRVAELLSAGDARAALVASIQRNLDEYLSVCQVGITLASVALGMCGKKAADVILGAGGRDLLHYVLAIGVSYVVVSGSHILLGELVPKSVAIRIADRSALWCAAPLRFFHRLFFPALWLLTRLANGVLGLFGMARSPSGEQHSEGELRFLLDQSQERGMMSFRRLLFIENVFDFGDLSVRDAMRGRSVVRCFDAGLPWPENLRIAKTARFTRYPLVDGDPDRPVGLVHLKDVVIREGDGDPDLRKFVRPIITVTETSPLEALLVEMQRRRVHAALVTDREGRWTGFVTLEDVIEELLGTIRDEFEDEEPVRLVDAVTPDRVHLDIEARSPMAAVRDAVTRMPPASLPLPAEQILYALEVRERLVGTYLGQGIGMPHARVAGLVKPFVMVLRSAGGVPFEGTTERAHLLFVVLSPAGQPRVHQRLQSIIATLLGESEFVKERLLTATSPAEVIDVIRTGEQAVLD